MTWIKVQLKYWTILCANKSKSMFLFIIPRNILLILRFALESIPYNMKHSYRYQECSAGHNQFRMKQYRFGSMEILHFRISVSSMDPQNLFDMNLYRQPQILHKVHDLQIVYLCDLSYDIFFCIDGSIWLEFAPVRKHYFGVQCQWIENLMSIPGVIHWTAYRPLLWIPTPLWMGFDQQNYDF